MRAQRTVVPRSVREHGEADQAAALMHSLARNHPLVDGNERLAWSATRVFCLLNGTDLVMDVDEGEQTVLATATGDLNAAERAEVIRRQLGQDARPSRTAGGATAT